MLPGSMERTGCRRTDLLTTSFLFVFLSSYRVAQDKPELLILLPLPPHCWDGRCHPSKTISKTWVAELSDVHKAPGCTQHQSRISAI